MYLHRGHNAALTTKMVAGFPHYFCSTCGANVGMQPVGDALTPNSNSVVFVPDEESFPAWINTKYGSYRTTLNHAEIEKLAQMGVCAASGSYVIPDDVLAEIRPPHAAG